MRQAMNDGGPAPEVPSPNQPLAGLVVVEIGHSVAAPFAGHVLGDLGATLVKIENPKGGDDTRSWGPCRSSRDGKASGRGSSQELGRGTTSRGRPLASRWARSSHGPTGECQ